MVQWIEEKGCRGPEASPLAVPYFASRAPVNTRPPWLHDNGGVMGPPPAPEDGDGAVGQPYKNEIWEYRVYGPDGYLIYASPTSETLSHSAGVARLQQILESFYGSGIKVCGVYKTYYGTGARYCYSAAGLKVETSTPTWAGTNGCRPGTSLGANGFCSYLQPPASPPSHVYYPPLYRRPVTTVVETVTTSVPQPPFTRQAAFNLRPIPSGFFFAAGPQWLGQACSEIQAQIDGLNQTKNATQQILTKATTARDNALAAGDTASVQQFSFLVDDAQQKLHDTETQLIQAKAALAACEANSQPPPPQQQCANDHPDCGAAGFICVNGDCVPGCRNDGDCGPGFRCVKAKSTDEVGSCEPVPTGTRKAGAGGWALVLLGLAAAGAILFRKPPGMSEEEA